jgi:hypothetical protein
MLHKLKDYIGHAIARAVSRLLHTAAARAGSQVRSCDILCGQSGTGADNLRVLRFPLPILIPPAVPCSLIILSSTLYGPVTDSAIKQPNWKRKSNIIWKHRFICRLLCNSLGTFLNASRETTKDRVTYFLASNPNWVFLNRKQEVLPSHRHITQSCQLHTSRLSKEYRPQVQTSSFIKACWNGEAVRCLRLIVWEHWEVEILRKTL